MASLTNSKAVYRFRYADSVYFHDGNLFNGVIVTLLYMIVAAALDAAGYVDSLALLIPVTLGALALGLLMSYSRFDGFFALSHSLFTGLAWILFLIAGLVSEVEIEPFAGNGIPELQSKAYFVLLRWLNWVDAAVNNTANEDNYVFVFEISFLVWWLTYLGVWAIFRYGYTWRAVIPAGLVLLINTYYAPRSILGFLVVFALLALVLLVRTNLSEHQLRWREQRIYFSQDIALDFLRTGFMFSVMVIALAWLAPGLGRNVQVRQVLAPVNEQWQQTTERFNRLYQGINRQARPTASTFGRSLTLGGARNVTDRPVFQAQTSQGRYWRAVVYDTYTGRQWLNTAEEEQEYDAGQPLPIAQWNLREPLSQTITLLASTGNVVFGAPDIMQASVPLAAVVRSVTYAPTAVTMSEEAFLPQKAFEIVMARARVGLEAGDSYSVVSRQTAVTERALESAGAAYPTDIAEQFLQLPENISPRVVQLAQDVAGSLTTAYAKANEIESFLRTYVYNDEIAAPEPEQDPLEYFLFDIREGYCDYYASSMVVMLRSLGVPARTVSGYAEGTLDDETGLYLVTERDAHTWVEVYFPGYGWIEFEPTAGESELNRPNGEEQSASSAAGNPDSGDPSSLDDPLLYEDSEYASGNLPAEDFFNIGDLTAVEQRNWWLWVIMTPVSLLIGLYLIWRSRVFGPTAFISELPPIFYDRLLRWATRIGIHLQPDHTPYERAVQLGRALPEGAAQIDEITDAYVHHQFGQQEKYAATEETKNQLDRSWQQLRPMFLRAWIRRRLHIGRRNKNPFTLIEE